MPTQSESRIVPFSPNQVFDLVADIEKYPEFVPMMVSTKVLRRDGNKVDVEMVLGFGHLHYRIDSRAVLSPYKQIDIRSTDVPFEHFNLHWLFEPAPGGGTKVELRGEFALEWGLVDKLVGAYAAEAVPAMVTAFVRRAERLYRPHRH